MVTCPSTPYLSDAKIPPPPLMASFASTPSSAHSSARTSMSMLLGSNLNVLLSARKDLPVTPSTKMKQLQWDKLPQQQVSKTLWNDEKPQKEQEMLQKLQVDGVWTEMEEDFKVKQLVMNLMGRCHFSSCGYPF
jgi:cytokinesis protein